jgi:hypothetical protein
VEYTGQKDHAAAADSETFGGLQGLRTRVALMTNEVKSMESVVRRLTEQPQGYGTSILIDIVATARSPTTDSGRYEAA